MVVGIQAAILCAASLADCQLGTGSRTALVGLVPPFVIPSSSSRGAAFAATDTRTILTADRILYDKIISMGVGRGDGITAGGSGIGVGATVTPFGIAGSITHGTDLRRTVDDCCRIFITYETAYIYTGIVQDSTIHAGYIGSAIFDGGASIGVTYETAHIALKCLIALKRSRGDIYLAIKAAIQNLACIIAYHTAGL